MKNVFPYIRRNRSLFIELIDSLTLAQINAVPDGFQNSIVWNFGHIGVSTVALVYKRTGIWPAHAEIPFFERYRKGSKHEIDADEDHMAFLKAYSLSSIDQLEQDYQAGVFASMEGYATHTYGLHMSTIEEVITCTLAHDSLHLGYALAQKRALKL
jgi:hypothetical protein